jgi:hypothetical protein
LPSVVESGDINNKAVDAIACLKDLIGSELLIKVDSDAAWLPGGEPLCELDT